MAMSYKKCFHQEHYSLPELHNQANEVRSTYEGAEYKYKRNTAQMVVNLTLTPTEYSTSYKIRLVARRGQKHVDVFVVDPLICDADNRTKAPHLYPDGSLCLFFPEYGEWHYSDSWAETLIPWTSLWLFYYEIWKETGQWNGGGIHGTRKKPIRKNNAR